MKKVISLILVVVTVFALCVPAFAAESTKTAKKGTNTLTGTVSYYSKEHQYGGDGDMYISATWSGSKVAAMYATAEVVDYLTGESLMNITNNSSDTTSAMSEAVVGIVNTRRVTVYGCGEIRDSFSLLVYPTIYGTYGKSDGT